MPPSPPQQCIAPDGSTQAKTTEADPDPVNEPCYTHSSCRGYSSGYANHHTKSSGYICCVAVGTCDSGYVSNSARYYVGGCRATNYANRTNSSTSTSNFYPTQDEGCVKAGECNLPFLEQMMGWTATGGGLTTTRIPDASMDRLLNGSTTNQTDGCRSIYGYAVRTTGATNKVTMAVVVAGTVESFTTSVLDAMEAQVALSLGVHAGDVSITAAAGSVILTTEVMTTSAAASGVQSSMTTLMGTPSAAGTALSVPGMTVTASAVIAPTTSAASATVSYSVNSDGTLAFSDGTAAQATEESTGVSTGVIIIIIVGAVVGIGLGLAVLFYMMKKTPKTEPGTKGVA